MPLVIKAMLCVTSVVPRNDAMKVFTLAQSSGGGLRRQ